MRATEELHELHELQDCVTKIFPWTAQTLKLSEAGEWLAGDPAQQHVGSGWGLADSWHCSDLIDGKDWGP